MTLALIEFSMSQILKVSSQIVIFLKGIVHPKIKLSYLLTLKLLDSNELSL